MASRGPLFVQRVRDEHPDRTVVVWFQDEARVGQQGTLTTLWAETGARPYAVKQTEYEWVYLYGAVNPMTGHSSAMLAPTVNTAYMNAHLNFISKDAGPQTHVVLVLDQAGWHRAKDLRTPENITLLPLPAYSPELNPIERLWAYLKSHYLSNQVFRDYDELFEKTKYAWNQMQPEKFQSVCKTDWITRMN